MCSLLVFNQHVRHAVDNLIDLTALSADKRLADDHQILMVERTNKRFPEYVAYRASLPLFQSNHGVASGVAAGDAMGVAPSAESLLTACDAT